MEQRRSQWQAAIQDVLAPRGVVLRNDTALRELEGLARAVEVGWGEVPDRVAFEESGVHYLADLREGQKTGFFFDQAENRTWAAARSPGARVLDVYAHLGGWALSAMVAGASSATAIDSSADACAAIEANAARNRVHVDVTRGDALEVMGTLPAASFEMVCVDPPALAKNRKSAGAALHHYRAINETAARLVVPGGLLLSSSCSHHVLRERFEDAVIGGVGRAGRRGVLVRRAGAAPDHPVLPGVPETEYLKHVVVQVG
jgi:23S rRNA (cytosine1962-C5)-methyltransferase